MAAASSYAWPSVVVYTEATLVKTRTIVKCDWSDNFGALLERLGDAFDNETVLKEAISNEKLINPTHVVPLDAPVRLLQTYDCHYDSYYLAASIAASEEAQTQQQAKCAGDTDAKTQGDLYYLKQLLSMSHRLALSSNSVVIRGFVMTFFNIFTKRRLAGVLVLYLVLVSDSYEHYHQLYGT